MNHALPDERLASRIVVEHLGWLPKAVRRFTSGLAFFVFDVSGDQNVAVRIGRPSQAQALQDGIALAIKLRPMGVPLPETLTSGTIDGFPFVIQQRPPGTDLGNVMHDLDWKSLQSVARAVADAQSSTARLGTAPRFGYAPRLEAAPHANWSDVVAAHITRSETRITANKLFPLEVVTEVQALFAQHAEALARIPATPFLHDTTTKNVIVTSSGAFSGIVDVDDLCYGDPRYAAALTKVAMLVHGGPLCYVDAWLAHAGEAQDQLFDFYVAVFLLDFMSEHGTTFNGNEAPSDVLGREKLLALLQQQLS